MTPNFNLIGKRLQELLDHKRLNHQAIDILVMASLKLADENRLELFRLLERRGVTEKIIQERYCRSRGLDVGYRAGEFYVSLKKERDCPIPLLGSDVSLFLAICQLHWELVRTKHPLFTKVKFI